ncbi:Zinc/iron-chelating domain protein [Quillaja saponaria]|uniref:Zinc/iron-chelating domain protein n=1 Tax=Quillaja saponaria TaxID=32244 RepID=A0AAD7Q0B5_QUISA|nr:Zinc/iron-chelating domain protein [Quillaja saponaria]KAJ7972486.1 Zinc/iron-chelating domain protein [Quillaja saponaria]
MFHAVALPFAVTVGSAANRPRRRAKMNPKTKQSQSTVGFGIEKKETVWRCVEGCGACCKLDKGPSFATPEEIFNDPADVELYKSLIGPDGWCIHYEKSTRKCSIYSDRPYFCRVEPEVFKTLFGIDKKKFNKEACSCCRDTIKSVYGSHSKELYNFNSMIRNDSSS